jgi:rhodanese-related sulfurtransferase
MTHPAQNPDETQSAHLASFQRRRWLAVAMAAGVGALLRPELARAGVDPTTVSEPKRTKAGHYLMAADVPAYIQAQGGAGKVLFLDLRTRAEAMYVGMATGVDALVPYVEHQEMMTDWDTQRGIYRLEPLQDFVSEVNRRLTQKGLAKSDVVVLICRSGDRSSRGANRLADDGYTQVWSVVDGFEGDMGKDGRRSVNGWKNAGLPWSYKLERERMYFPR